ncbi:TlpA family protein disulfide reductase [Taibaiella chishuiensis]|nr:TlpA disulfide reductase family protein [Taibaiella chishuiensis]
MMMIIKKLLVLPFLLSLTVAYAAPQNDDPQTLNKEQPAAGFPDSVKAAVPQLRFKDGKGKSLTLPDLKGKVVVLNYWAPWCPPCVKEMPSFHKLRTRFRDRDDLVFVMVAVDHEYAKAKAFMDRRGYKLPVYTSDGQILNALFSGAIPTTAIFNRANELIDIYIETNDFSVPDFVEKLQQLLDQ